MYERLMSELPQNFWMAIETRTRAALVTAVQVLDIKTKEDRSSKINGEATEARSIKLPNPKDSHLLGSDLVCR